jgi:branched-subunit amino acid transport protein
MLGPEYVLTIFGMGLVTYIPRWLPLFLIAQRQLPRWVIEWLDLIPVAILCALIFPELFTFQDSSSVGLRQLEPLSPKSLVAIPTLVFAILTKSLGGTVIVGMSLYWLASACM